MTHGSHLGELFFSELQRKDEHVITLSQNEAIVSIRGDFVRELSNLEFITSEGRTFGPYCPVGKEYDTTSFMVGGEKGKPLAFMSGYLLGLSHDWRKYYKFYFYC